MFIKLAKYPAIVWVDPEDKKEVTWWPMMVTLELI